MLPRAARRRGSPGDSRSQVSPEVLEDALNGTREALRRAVTEGLDAPQLTRLAHETAWRRVRLGATAALPAEQADAAMAVASLALLRPPEVAKLAQVDAGSTRVLVHLARLTAGQDPDHPRLAVDATASGGSLDPLFADGSQHQAFHMAFFTAAGYVAAGDPVLTTKALGAAFLHETLLDEGVRRHVAAGAGSGASREDWLSSAFGILAGQRLRALRDEGRGELMATVLSGAMVRTPSLLPRRLPEQDHAEAMSQIRALRRQREAWLPLADHPAVRGLVGPDSATMRTVVRMFGLSPVSPRP
ncbi:MAG: hypothetical protein VKO21_04260 [Candidatus Sericytochromatia bacterium]|nr:hypothetical protein [Candidatus Sericytochromatia bacterium]